MCGCPSRLGGEPILDRGIPRVRLRKLPFGRLWEVFGAGGPFVKFPSTGQGHKLAAVSRAGDSDNDLSISTELQ